MSYKTILVQVDDSRHANQRIRLAIKLAQTHAAHLIGVAATGMSRYATPEGSALPPNPNLATHLTYLRERAQRVLEQAALLVQQEGGLNFEQRLIDDDAAGAINSLAYFCDLIVISQADPLETGSITPADCPEYLVFSSPRPVLILPHAGTHTSVGKRVLVAWDGGRAATRAVADALPLLRQAEIVQVVCFKEHAPAESKRAIAGNEIALYLARHGVKTELLPSRPASNVGDALLSLAADLGADLIVMGGYGHSRFREILLGGVTRLMIDTMTIPVLMSH